ncbi:MAG: sensor histidine kinase [Caulobacteraceae bacterium]
MEPTRQTSAGAPGQRDWQYRALFEAMSEGFALCEPIWDGKGKLVDYRIIEINPALQAMLGVGPEVAGRRASEGPPLPSAWLAVCERAFRGGESVGFEFHNANTGRWHEIRLTRVTEERLAQFFFDVTERKEAEAHQAQLFDELNHRVKNSLAMVSGLLRMQAKAASPALREHLKKAVARVEAIADVHGALYQGGRKTRIEFASYLNLLCERLQASVLDGRVRIEVKAQPEDVSIDHAAPLGMIVNELVTNAAKHAYPAPARGVIDVCFERTGDSLTLSVADDGPGPPKDKAGAGGLGMRLVKSLVAQLGGRLTISGPPGARFAVRLPQSDDAADLIEA